MPTVTLSYETVKSGIGKKLSDAELKERISMLGTDLESLSKDGIVVEVFPNRPDMLSEFGFIRALRSFLGVEPGLKHYKAKSSGKRVIVKPSVLKVRPYTACAIVKNLKLDDERIQQLIQLQEKLHLSHCRDRAKGAIGIYPSDKIKYPIEFFAEDPSKVAFVPLGETRKMNGLEILRKHKAGKAYAHLLSGKSKFPFFRDAAGKIMSMPPIINSEFTGKITEATTEVFIECSGFDLNFLKKLLNIIICELSDMGGEIYSMELVYPNKHVRTPELKPERMKLSTEYVYRMLGQRVNIKACLERMGHSYENGMVLVPCYRVDILHPIDLVEDIAIAHGYENFEPELPNISTIGTEVQIEKLKRIIAQLMIGLGFMEVATFNVTNNTIQRERMQLKGGIIEFSNYKSSEYSGLRQSMIASLLEVLERNTKHEYPQKVFDMGTLFFKNDKEETGVLEEEWLGVLLSGKIEDFTKAKQTLEYVLSGFGLSCKIEPVEHPSFIHGRVGEIRVKHRVLGIIGELHPAVLTRFKLEMPVAGFELNLNKLIELL
ncbi:phenylalanine--tRNA ligase subunit beta [Candidatus Woesearchaeota archaeon]|nr:phenylalanine--tRNA ligase subunit beta [Candidatus Woesearchaeota archaeon]RLE43575.1 MAG: phenylalanine--tRNA ligase subunit beta [Candidatus Woesearchaeota archaeon]